MKLECNVLPEVPVQALLADDKRLSRLDEIENSWVKSVLTTWTELIKTYKLNKDVKILSWLAYDQGFVPNRTDLRFEVWVTKGIKIFLQIVKENQMKSFDGLRESFGLENQDLYWYLQTRSYYNQENKQNDDHYNPLIEIFIKAYKSELSRGIISKIYKCLNNLGNHSTQYIKNKWEREGNFTLTDEEWENICTTQ